MGVGHPDVFMRTVGDSFLFFFFSLLIIPIKSAESRSMTIQLWVLRGMGGKKNLCGLLSLDCSFAERHFKERGTVLSH